MDTNDKQQHIDDFYEAFRSLPNAYTIEKVYQLINNPNAKATHRVHQFSNHLKITIMTSVIIIGAIAFLFKNSPESIKPNSVDSKQELTTAIQNNPVKPSENLIANNTTINSPFKADEDPKTEDKRLVVNQEVVQADSASKKNIISVNSVTNSSTEHHWPADTVLDGKSLFVTLTDEELLKLGVKVTKDATLYCNKSSNGHGSSLSWNPSPNYHYKNTDTTHFSFELIFLSGSNIEENSRIDIKDYSMMDTLLPIITVDKFNPSGKSICWFSTNHKLFNALPERYKNLEIKYKELKLLKNNNPNKIYVNYFNLEENLKRLWINNYIQLSDKELVKLGYEIINDTTFFGNVTFEKIFNEKLNEENKPDQFPNNPKVYKKGDTVFRKIFKLRSNDKYDPYILLASYKINGNISFRGSLPAAWIIPKIKHPYPKVITDSLGRFINIDDQIEISDFNTLIPIKIDGNRYGFRPTINVNQVHEIYKRISRQRVYLFWYEPDSAFISRLPKSIASVLKPEYDAIVKSGGTSSQSCTYFEICKSTLTLNRLDVYPNPAQQMVTIDFNAPEDMTGQISLIDIKGSEVKVLQPTTHFVKGENKFRADVSGINSGIYMIYFNTNKGFRTHRIVVTK